MFHIELRQFPHNMCHFNMTEEDLFDSIVDGWAREQWIEMGDRKWNPHQSKLVVLEGPRIPVEQLSMGRGWPTAQRQSEDVTERVIARAKQAAQPRPALLCFGAGSIDSVARPYREGKVDPGANRLCQAGHSSQPIG